MRRAISPTSRPDQHALACGVHETQVRVGRDFGDVLTLAARLLDGLVGHVAGFALDQTRRHFDVRIRGDQLLADFAAQAVHQRTLELTLEVAADVGAELIRHRRS